MAGLQLTVALDSTCVVSVVPKKKKNGEQILLVSLTDAAGVPVETVYHPLDAMDTRRVMALTGQMVAARFQVKAGTWCSDDGKQSGYANCFLQSVEPTGEVPQWRQTVAAAECPQLAPEPMRAPAPETPPETPPGVDMTALAAAVAAVLAQQQGADAPSA